MMIRTIRNNLLYQSFILTMFKKLLLNLLSTNIWNFEKTREFLCVPFFGSPSSFQQQSISTASHNENNRCFSVVRRFGGPLVGQSISFIIVLISTVTGNMFNLYIHVSLTFGCRMTALKVIWTVF